MTKKKKKNLKKKEKYIITEAILHILLINYSYIKIYIQEMFLVLVLVNFFNFVKTTSMRKEVVHMSQFNEPELF